MRNLFLILLFSIISLPIWGQTLFSETFDEPDGVTSGVSTEGIGWSSVCTTCNGANHTWNTDGTFGFQNFASLGPATWTTNNINISACTGINFSMDFTTFPTAVTNGSSWNGGNNLDSPAQCVSGAQCLGDPNNPTAGQCAGCWDFFLVELLFDGNVVYSYLVGRDTSLHDNYTFTYNTASNLGCLQPGAYNNAVIRVKSQSWAQSAGNEEYLSFGNVTLTCTTSPVPDITDLADVTVCAPDVNPFSYTLPAITGTNLSGTQAYYTGPNGTGTSYLPGTNISLNMATTTLYMYNITAQGCSDEKEFVITKVVRPNITAPALTVTGCGQYTLPAITTTPASGYTTGYYTGPNQTGTMYLPGQIITGPPNTVTLYKYAYSPSMPSCFDEEAMTITIIPPPVLNDIPDVTVCGGYVLPAITGTNLQPSPYSGYYQFQNGTGTNYPVGSTITTTRTVYIYAVNPGALTPLPPFAQCPTNYDTESVNITVLPVAIAPTDVISDGVCGPGVVNLSASGCAGGTIEWFANQTTTTVLATGNNYSPSITNTTTYYVACNVGGCLSTRVPVAATVFPIPPAPTLTVDNNPTCPGEQVTFTATGGADCYEFYVDGLVVQASSPDNTFGPVTLAAGQVVTVKSFNCVIYDGNITENAWGTGPVEDNNLSVAPDAFGTNAIVNALYVTGTTDSIQIAIAGRVTNTYRILLFIDSKAGGYNVANFGDFPPPIIGPLAFNSFNNGSVFDTYFNADYCLALGTNPGEADYFIDLMTLDVPTSPKNYIGNNNTPANPIGVVPASGTGDLTHGFEVGFLKSLIGYAGGDIKFFAMAMADNGTLGNSFLSPALSGTNYGNGAIFFASADPNPVIVPGDALTPCMSNVSNSITISVTTVPAAPMTAPVNYCQNDQTEPLTATPVMEGTLNWYGTNPTGGTASPTAPTPSSAIPGNTTYYVSQSVGGCEGPRAAITVFVTASPAAPTVTSPVVYCEGDAATALSATPSAGGTLNWYGTIPIGGTASATAPIPSTASASSTTYYVSQTVSGCEGPRASIVVTVNTCACPNPATVNAGASTTICASDVPFTLSGSFGGGATSATWTTGGSGTFANATNPTTTYNPSAADIAAGSVLLTLTTNDPDGAATPCSAATASITLTITPNPAQPTVTSPVSYCQNTTTATPLTATPSAGGTLLWWGTNATGGTSSATAPTPSTSSVGSTTYYVSQTVGTCESNRAAIVVNTNANPNPPTVTSPVNYCVGELAAALTATATPGNTLLWWGTNATGGTSSATAPTPSTGSVGSTTYYVSQTDGTCESTRVAIVVNVSNCACPNPATVNAGASTTICASNVPFTLSGSFGGGATSATWTTGGSGTFANATNPTTTYNPSAADIAAGSVLLTLTTNDPDGAATPCSAATASITLTITPNPAQPTVTSPVSYCQNTTTATPLTATPSAGGTLLWWGTNATGGTSSATAPTPSTSSVGSTTYYVSQTVGTCESNRAAIVVNIIANPNPPTVTSPVNYCVGELAAALTATATPGNTLLWWGTNATGGTSTATAPTPSTGSVGSTTYYVSQTDGTCESTRAAIVVNVSNCACPNPATVNAGTSTTICASDVPFTLSGSFGGGATSATWTTGGSGTFANATNPTTTYNPSAADIAAGSVLLTLTTNDPDGAATPCSAATASITLTITPNPAQPTVTSPVSYCQNTTTATPLTATPSAGGTLLWWGTNATGGTSSATAPTPSTSSVGSTTYYVSQTVGTCESNRAAIVVNIIANPNPPTVTSPVNYCVGELAAALTATATPGNTLLWWGTNATGGTSTATAPTPSTGSVGSTTYYVSQTDGTCESTRVAIVVVISNCNCPNPATVNAGASTTICASNVPFTLSGSFGGGATSATWSTGGSGTFANTTNPTTTYNPSAADIAAGSVLLTLTTNDPDGAATLCTAATASITLTITPTPAQPTVTTPVTYCQNATTATPLTATPNAGGTLLWWGTNATGGTSSATAPTPSTSSVGSTTYYVSQTVGTCESNRAPIVVKIIANPNPPTVTSPVNYCVGELAAALTATATPGNTLLWWGTNATGGTSTATAPTPSTGSVGSTTYYVSQTDGTCESTRAAIVVIISNCNCPNAATVNAGASTTICASDVPFTLSGSFGGGATSATWSTGGSGTFANTTNPTTTYNPSAADIAAGSVLLTLTTNDPDGAATLCTAATASITLTITPNPAPPTVTTPVNYCQNEPASALSATPSTGGTLLWWGTNQTGGTSSATAPTPSTASVGSTTYYVSQTIGTCESTRAAIVVNIIANPNPPTVTSPVNYCVGELAAALTATATPGNTLLWWGTNATGGSSTATAPTPSTGSVGSTTYYVSQTDGTCESTRAAIVVIISNCNCPNAATVNAGASTTICASDVPFTLSGSFGGGATSATWTTGGSGTFANTTNPTTTYNPSAADIAAGSVLLTLTTNDPDGLLPYVQQLLQALP